MATNITVFAVDGPVVIYFQDGTSTSITAQQEKHFQLIEGGFCTISDSPAELEAAEPIEGSEHPPPGYAFASIMLSFWQEMLDELEEQQEEVNPL